MTIRELQKRLTAAVSVLALFASADEVVMTTQYADGSTNTWTQGDLQAALGLMNRKYHRDMGTESGRTAWHGKRLGQYLVTNDVGRITIVNLYTDGYVHTNAGTRASTIYKDPEASAKAAAEAAARAEAVRATWESANLPPDLAALRAAQRAAAVTNEVTVTITP